MADTRLEQICQYAFQSVDDAGKPAALLVDRQRTLPLDESLLPAAVLYLMRETVVKLMERSSVAKTTAVLRWELRVHGEPSDQLLDPIRAWVHGRMMRDFSMGGLVRELAYLGSQWDQREADLVVGACAMDFEVTFYTRVNDLTTLA